MYDKEINDIFAENCGESSFQEGLSWGDGQRLVQIGALGEALRKFGREGDSSTLLVYLRKYLSDTDSEKKKKWFFMCKVCGMWCVKQYKTNKSHHVKKKGAPVYSVRGDHKGSRSYYTSRIISF